MSSALIVFLTLQALQVVVAKLVGRGSFCGSWCQGQAGEPVRCLIEIHTYSLYTCMQEGGGCLPSVLQTHQSTSTCNHLGHPVKHILLEA